MSHTKNSDDEFSELRAASDALHSHFIHGPSYDDATFVQKALPLANRLLTTEESVDVYLLFRYWQHMSTGSNLPHDTDDLVSAQDGATTSVLGELVGTDELVIDDLVSTEGQLVRQAREFRQYSQALGKEFRRALCLIQDGQGTDEELREFIDAAINDLILVSTLKWTGKKKHIETKYCPLSDRAIVGITLMMISDESGKILDRLRICKLDSCDNFFLSMPGPYGGGLQLYCKGEHQKEAVRQTGANRTAKWRKEKAKKGEKQRSRKR